MEKQFKLVCVRHGQADHNVENNAKKMKFTDEELPALDTDLTKEGRTQAEKVANQLMNEHFHFVVSSDLKRAKDTARAIVDRNDSIKHIVEWKVVRERRMGIFEGSADLCHAQLKVEAAVEDRNLLTWRIPKGESVVDLKKRVQSFLELAIKEAEKIPEVVPTILLVSHGLFLKELHRFLSNISECSNFQLENDYYPNTGVSEYKILYNAETKTISQVDCHKYGCAKHL